MSVAIKAYVAGYIDAKSCITTAGGDQWVVKIQSTDKKAIQFIHKNCGGTLAPERTPNGGRVNRAFRLTFYRADAVSLLSWVLPYLVTKKTQAVEMIKSAYLAKVA